MKSSIFFAAAGVFAMTFLVGLSTATADDKIEWKQILGNVQTGDLVGVGANQVMGAAPWAVTRGRAKVDLEYGDVEFKVRGLVLTVGSAPAFGLVGIDIGTPGGITTVKGTLVCDVDGSAGGGHSTLVDTPAVPLSARGDAKFEGNIGPLPAACDEPDIAFLIRIPGFELYIAFGAVRND